MRQDQAMDISRLQLQKCVSVQDVVLHLKVCRRIIVITGAGISVSCGIPDFRSKDTGLYNSLNCDAYGIPSAELMFDLEYFKIDPLPFYRFSKSLLDERIPSFTHRFIYHLQTRRKLLRNYSQNIDGLELKSKVLPCKLIECHGSMSIFKCVECKKKKKLAEVQIDLLHGHINYCKCGGVMKPSITFFGEVLPPNLARAMAVDIPKCDCVLVIGTSLKVGGSVVELLKSLDDSIPQILINKDPVQLSKSGDWFDVSLLGACDDILKQLCSKLNWTVDEEGSSCDSVQSPSSLCDDASSTSRKISDLQSISTHSPIETLWVQQRPRVFELCSRPAKSLAATASAVQSAADAHDCDTANCAAASACDNSTESTSKRNKKRSRNRNDTSANGNDNDDGDDDDNNMNNPVACSDQQPQSLLHPSPQHRQRRQITKPERYT